MAKLKQGDTIRGYALLEDFRMANGANCEWTFAEKGGEHFFVKAFLSPKYPLDGAPGSPETIAKKRDVCAAFEAHQRKLLKSAAKVAGAGGKLVVPIEFFREGTLYYKVARKIDAVTMDVDDIARLALEEKLAMMGAIVAAIYALHNAGIVHGDLKPANILISRTAKHTFNANVIDFDSSYISAEPPSPEWLTGDPPFYSPELLSYIKGYSADGRTLTVQSDIFALGLVFWQFLLGVGPQLPRDCHYACEAASAGNRLTMPPSVRHDVAEMIEQMLSLDADSRPLIARFRRRSGRYGGHRSPSVPIHSRRRCPGRWSRPIRPGPPAACGAR